jgi:hypothetical protein
MPVATGMELRHGALDGLGKRKWLSYHNEEVPSNN